MISITSHHNGTVNLETKLENFMHVPLKFDLQVEDVRPEQPSRLDKSLG